MKSSLLFTVSFLIYLSTAAQTNLAIDGSKAIGDIPCCGFTLAQAFDGIVSTGPLLTKFPASIGYSFEDVTILNSYRWHDKVGSGILNQPFSWQFQGSGDGESWVTLHRVIENSAITGFSEYFKFHNNTPYKYYRMRIMTSNSNQVSIGELEMFKLPPPDIKAKLEVSLIGDSNSNGKINPGEKLTYTTTITNSGQADAIDLNLSISAPANTKRVDGSIKTSALTKNDDFYSVASNKTLLGSSVLKNDFGLPSLSVIFFGNVDNPSSVRANGVNVGNSNKGGIVKFKTDGTFSYTPPQGFGGYDQFAYVASSGTLPDDVGVVTVVVGSPVMPVDDYYNITGNVYNMQDVSAGLLSNDNGSSIVVTAVEGKSENVGVGVATTKAGTVYVQSNGSFIYYPPVGYEGNDSFNYTVNNLFNIPKTATVHLSVSGMFWFINNTASEPGNGTLAFPFKSLASFNHINNGVGSNPGPGDNIILCGGGSDYSEGVRLLDNQKLIGQGGKASVEEITGIVLAIGSAPFPSPRGESPIVSNLSGSALVLGVGNRLSGLLIGNSLDAAIKAQNFGVLTIDEVQINTTGQALSLIDGTLKGSFESIISSGGMHNIYLKNVATVGVSAFGVSSDRISGAINDALMIDGGDGSFTYTGSVTNTSTLAINITNKTGGTVTTTGNINLPTGGKGISVSNCSNGTIVNFNGAGKWISSTNMPGINLLNNRDSYINFNGGGLNIISTNSDGFSAFEGGTITVAGSNNTISSNTGIALKLVNTTIGASGLTFKSISANGGSNGIVLDYTGSIAGLTVTGDQTVSSGGIIQNTLGRDGQSSGNGIYLNHTNKINLNLMKLNDHNNNAIYGSSVSDLVLNKLCITGINGTNNTATYEESAVHLIDLGGMVSLKNSSINGGAYNNILVRNTSSVTLDALVFDEDTINAEEDNLPNFRNVALQVDISNGVAQTKIMNSVIHNWRGDAIRVTYQDLGSGTAEIVSNDVRNSVDAPAKSSGIFVSGGELEYTIANNSVQNAKLKAISAEKESFGKYMRGTISGNTIGISGVSNSGAAAGYGIYASHCGLNTTSVAISNNIIQQVAGNDGVRVIAGEDSKGGGGGVMNVLIKDNDFSEPGNNPSEAIFVMCGIAAADQGHMCVDLKGNKAMPYSKGFTLKQKKSTKIKLAGYTGNYNNLSQVSLYLRTTNLTTKAAVETTGGGFYNTEGGTTCPQ